MPTETPPTDHGSDRFGYVEVDAPLGYHPDPQWFLPIADAPCPDCPANLFARYVGPAASGPVTQERQSWHLTVAHDPTCPLLAAHECEAH